MSHWPEIVDEAGAARRLMLCDRVAGEDEFQRLLKANPDEATIYRKRGEAYEALGQGNLAAADYRKAEELLALAGSEDGAREASARVTNEVPCRGPDRLPQADRAGAPLRREPSTGDPTEERIEGLALGGGYLLACYLDADGGPTPRSLAVYVEYVEYDAGHREVKRSRWDIHGQLRPPPVRPPLP